MDEGTGAYSDAELREVAEELKRLDPTGRRWANVIRHTYDVVYNGQETGRYRWDQLMKTEKTHFGTLFEINAQREFQFDDGETTDFRIADHQVDAKWSQKKGAWMLPPEVFGEIALVATASDENSVWSLGLIRVTEENRRNTVNRDQKTTLSRDGKANVLWLWEDEPLPPNVLLQLPSSVVAHIFDHRYGTERVNRLFRAAEGLPVHRNSVATVARQLDAQKRVRSNGGARSTLGKEGYLILSGVYHRDLAVEFDGPDLGSDEYLSLRVVPSNRREDPRISGEHWRRAEPDEPAVEPAPHVEDRKPLSDDG